MKSYVYVLILKDTNMLKIGKADNVFKRIKQLEKHWGEFDLERSFVFECNLNYVNKLERLFHGVFYYDRIKNLEKGDGYSEFFNISVLGQIESIVNKSLPFYQYIEKISIKDLNTIDKSVSKELIKTAEDLMKKYSAKELRYLIFLLEEKLKYKESRTKEKNKDYSDHINKFQKTLLLRDPQDLKELYTLLKNIYIKENRDIMELNRFFNYILSGIIPVGILLINFQLYMQMNNDLMTVQQCSRILTTLFNKSFKKRLNKADSGSTRVKSIGESLDITLLDNIIAA